LSGSITKRSLGIAIALGVFLAAAIGAFTYYRDRLADNYVWANSVKVERETRLVNRVFEISKANGLIALRRDRGGRLLIDPPNCEQTMLDDKSDPAKSERSAALTLLCNSSQGAQVVSEIEVWNTSFNFLAIRDNRSQNNGCARSDRAGDISKLKVDVFVPYGCKPNDWGIARMIEGGDAAAAWMPGAEPPPDQYDFLLDNDEPMTYAGDWARVSPDPDKDDAMPAARYQLTSKKLAVPANGIVSIELVGRLRSIKIDGDAPIVINTNSPNIEKWTKQGGAFVKVWLVCHPEDLADEDDEESGDDDDEGGDDELADCSSEPTAADEVRFAYKIDVTQFIRGAPRPRGATAREIDIVLEAETNTYLPRRLRDGEDKKGAKLRLTRHLRVDCNDGWLSANKPESACRLDWIRVGDVDIPSRADHRIVMGDGTKPGEDLIDPKTGLILSQAFDSGFAPIVGYGPQQWGSLTATLASQPASQPLPRKRGGRAPEIPPEVFKITIDQRIQKAALDTLATKFGCRSKRADGESPLPACNKLNNSRSATLVVLDADKNPGDIRALVSQPAPRRKLHLWDLTALDEGELGQSGLGWRALSKDSVPGSTFKSVTAISAIATATAPDTEAVFARDLRKLLMGGMDVKEQVAFLRLGYAPTERRAVPRRGSKRGRLLACEIDRTKPPISANTIPAPNPVNPQYCGRNFGKASYWQVMANKDTRCPEQMREQFGMCEALQKSSNIFYGGVAQRLFYLPGTTQGGIPLTLRVARRLSFGSDVVRGSTFDLTRGKASSSRLGADPVFIASAVPGAAVKNPGSIVRTGFGDDVTATPLAMATIYASIASRKVVRPSLVPLPRDSNGCPVNKADDDECGELLPGARDAGPLLNALRAGFRGVARTRPFKTVAVDLLNAEDRLYVKTGTATIIRGTRFSTWVAGWVQGKPNTAIPTTLSFACFAPRRGNADTGGRVCGEIIREFLNKLSQGGGGP
jgi:hypothetical protein